MIDLGPRPAKKRTETNLVRAVLASVGAIRGVRATRNNVGTILDVRGIPVTFGLAEGSPDVVGIVTFGGVNTSVPSLIGCRPIAIAFGIEVKEEGKAPKPNQRTWAAVATKRGLECTWVAGDSAAADAAEWVRRMIEVWTLQIRAIGGKL